MTEKRYKRLVSSIDYYYCIDTNDDKGLTEEDMLNLLNEQDERIKKLSEENEKLKKYNKGQELEIIRLHNLADAMSAVLRELGIYDVYNDEQIENVKRRIIND